MICSRRVRRSRGSRWNRSRLARGSQRGWSSKLSNQSIFGTPLQSISAVGLLGYREAAVPILHFVRHGESEANLLHQFSNRDQAHALTELGRQQVEQLAVRLAGVSFVAFYCSPIYRARQSAEILSARLGIPFEVSPALGEYDMGTLEGRSDAASWAEYWALRDAWLVRHDWDARIEGGESFNDMRQRFLPFIDGFRSLAPDNQVLLLGHGGTYICMLPLVVSNVNPAFANDRGLGHIESIEVRLEADLAVCLKWGDTVPPSP